MQRAYIHKALRGNQNNKVIETDANGNIVYGEKSAASSGASGLKIYSTGDWNSQNVNNLLKAKFTSASGTPRVAFISYVWMRICDILPNGDLKTVFTSANLGISPASLGYDSTRNEIWCSSSDGTLRIYNATTFTLSFSATGVIPTLINGHFVFDADTDLMYCIGNNATSLYIINAGARTVNRTISGLGQIDEIHLMKSINKMFFAHKGGTWSLLNLANDVLERANREQYLGVNNTSSKGIIVINELKVIHNACIFTFAQTGWPTEAQFGYAAHFPGGGIKVGAKYYMVYQTGNVIVHDETDFAPIDSIQVSGGVLNTGGTAKFLDYIAETGFIFYVGNNAFNRIKI
jgi:hypothetical protein